MARACLTKAGLWKRPQKKPNTRSKRQSRVCFRFVLGVFVSAFPINHDQLLCCTSKSLPNDGEGNVNNENSFHAEIFTNCDRFCRFSTPICRARAGPCREDSGGARARAQVPAVQWLGTRRREWEGRL